MDSIFSVADKIIRTAISPVTTAISVATNATVDKTTQNAVAIKTVKAPAKNNALKHLSRKKQKTIDFKSAHK
ncbi:unnamed protein product [Leptidea sinapis]|uniref:Uncharacterized protein n=1 Tax=Leptidea sinapis TaxID=189913 RepID=A0A5E4QSB7_9NEOP|nr:unnamed protein product [Leptidea sinapis]